MDYILFICNFNEEEYARTETTEDGSKSRTEYTPFENVDEDCVSDDIEYIYGNLCYHGDF